MVNPVPIAIVCTLVGVIICLRLITLHRRSIRTKSSLSSIDTMRPGSTSFLGKLSLVFPHKPASDVLPRTRSDIAIVPQPMAQAVPQRVASMPTLHAPRPALVLRTCIDPGRPPTPPPRFDLVGPPPPKFEEVMASDAASRADSLDSRGGSLDSHTGAFGSQMVNVGTVIALPPPAYSPRA